MTNQIPPPPSAGSATTHSDAVSLPQRSSRRRPGAANAHSSRTDPPVSDDNTHSRSLPQRTSRLRQPGAVAAHPPEPPGNSRVRRARSAGAAASAADPGPDPPISDDDGPTSEPSSRLRSNSQLRRSRRSGASAADSDPEPPVSDDDGDSDDEDPTSGSDDDGDSDDEDPTSGSDDDGHSDDEDPTYSPPSSLPRGNSRLRRARRLGPSASAAHRDRQPPVSDDDSCSDDDDPTDLLQGRNSHLRTSEPPMNRRRSRHSRSLGATVADPNPVPRVSEAILNQNSEFPNSDEWDAIEGLLALKDRAHLPPKNQSSKKPEKEMNDQLNDVRASLNTDWDEIKHAFDGKSVHSFCNEMNSKEDEGSFKAPAAEADWAVKKTRSGDARIQQMIKLESDKFSGKLNQIYEDIKDIKQILLTRNSKEN